MRDQPGGSVVEPIAHSVQAAGLVNCWQLHGKMAARHSGPRRSVGLLLALLGGLLPSKQSNPSKGHSLAPTLPMLQNPCAPWDGSHASETSLSFLVCVIAGCSAPPPPVRPSISSTINHETLEVLRGSDSTKVCHEKGPSGVGFAGLAAGQDFFLFFFFFTKHQIILINKLCNIVI